jgi:hypothetical protein
LSCRYAYLKEQESIESISDNGGQEIPLAASFSQDLNLRDSVKTDSVSWLPIVKGIVAHIHLRGSQHYKKYYN